VGQAARLQGREGKYLTPTREVVVSGSLSRAAATSPSIQINFTAYASGAFTEALLMAHQEEIEKNEQLLSTLGTCQSLARAFVSWASRRLFTRGSHHRPCLCHRPRPDSSAHSRPRKDLEGEDQLRAGNIRPEAIALQGTAYRVAACNSRRLQPSRPSNITLCRSATRAGSYVKRR
jgi:hypothetical protein